MASIVDRVPDQTGRTAFVTGGTRGLGLEVTSALVSKGASVLFAGRDEDDGNRVLQRLRREHPAADVEYVRLDLADLSSVTAVAERVAARGRLDLLINSAGIMAPPLGFSVDGFESQWATNVIGPFSLTAQLLPTITGTAGSRVVTVSSIAHWFGAFSMDRVRLEVQGSGYVPFLVYCRTKLADLLITRELGRRLRAVGSTTLSVAAHPGVAGTAIAASPVAWAGRRVQDAAVAAWDAVTPSPAEAMESILTAAIAPGVNSGDLIGPRGLMQTRGLPARVPSSRLSKESGLAIALVGYLEQVTGQTLSP